jgi:transcriptional regulator PpsR
MKKGRQILESLLDSRHASRAIASAADLTLVLDREGTVLEVSLGEGIEPHAGWNSLVGKQWVDTLAKDGPTKSEQFLREARDEPTNRSREFQQRAEGLGEIPFRFSAVPLDDQGHIVVLGRDLRAVTSLQQRMISTQQAMDREYGRLRQADTRYRVLFHACAEGVIIADANRRVVELNPAAESMLGESSNVFRGRTLQELFESSSRSSMLAMLAAVETGARPSEVQVRLQGRGAPRELTLSGLLFRQAGAPMVLLRLLPSGTVVPPDSARASRMLALLDGMPDGFVVTGEDGRILSANAAFCELVQLGNENQVMGEPLERWLGRPGVDLHIMLANLREYRTVRNFATIVRGNFAAPQEAVVTAVAALEVSQPCIGFIIRSVSSAMSVPSSVLMPRSVEQLRELVGRVPLKDLVRESADLIERLCIEAALEVSGNNRASAAQLLGVSRQGLYSKLRRHGLAEFGPA